MGEGPPAARLDRGRLALELVLAAGGQEHRAAGLGQAAGHAEARAGPGDDRRLTPREKRPAPAISPWARSATALSRPALGARTRMRA